MGSGQKKLMVLLQKINLLEFIYKDSKVDWSYLEELVKLRERINKIPKLVQLGKESILKQELESITNDIFDRFDEINPASLKNYLEKFGYKFLGGSQDSDDMDDLDEKEPLV